MRKYLSFLAVSLVFAFIALSNFSFATTRGISVTAKEGKSLYLYRDYHAVVVGVSNYEKWPKIPNAVIDAQEVAAKLRELGFEVKLTLDPTAREMQALLNEMAYEIGREESRALLFYYAGHGETETLADKTKMGYLVPRDCPRLDKDPMGFATHAISMRDIESLSLRIHSKHVLMLFDSCFSGALFSLVRAVPDDITEKSALPVRQYVTAGREDEKVPDKSMFKRCFLIGLDGDADLTGDGYITGSELGMYLSDKVVNYTHRGQHPQYGKINNPDLDRGDFIFVPLSKPESKPDAGQETASEEARPQKDLEKEVERLKAEMEETSRMLKELKDKKEEEKRLAYIPKGSKAVLDQLRSGKGPFLIDDFEDKDLWSVTCNSGWKKYGQNNRAQVKVSVDETQAANGTSCSMKIEYKLAERSAALVQIGGHKSERLREVERNKSAAIDLSRFKKITFYLKGKKKKTFLSKPNRLYLNIGCYGEGIKSRFGSMASYYNKTIIRPDTEWQKIEIPFDDFVPSGWTEHHVHNYPSKPDLDAVLNLSFMFSSWEGDKGIPGSNTVWIDEIRLE